jgi:enamine deaminase RidA (YjgF/YER057c/UK114 family)
MPLIEHFKTPENLPPATGFDHATAGTGRFVAISGQLPLTAAGELVDESDALAQARQVFRNLRTALAVAGAKPADVMKFGFFLTNLDDLDAVRTARDEFVGENRPPASTLVKVAGLVVPGARIEVDALAITRY